MNDATASIKSTSGRIASILVGSLRIYVLWVLINQFINFIIANTSHFRLLGLPGIFNFLIGMILVFSIPFILLLWVFLLARESRDLSHLQVSSTLSPWHAVAILLVPIYGWAALAWLINRDFKPLYFKRKELSRDQRSLVRTLNSFLLILCLQFTLIVLGFPFSQVCAFSPLGFVFGVLRRLFDINIFRHDFYLDFIVLLLFVVTLMKSVKKLQKAVSNFGVQAKG